MTNKNEIINLDYKEIKNKNSNNSNNSLEITYFDYIDENKDSRQKILKDSLLKENLRENEYFDDEKKGFYTPPTIKIDFKNEKEYNNQSDLKSSNENSLFSENNQFTNKEKFMKEENFNNFSFNTKNPECFTSISSESMNKKEENIIKQKNQLNSLQNIPNLKQTKYIK